MSLDYTNGCVNFRDVGEWVNLISGRDLLATDKLLRGGKLDHINSPTDVGFPKTILNLRRGEDRGIGFLGAEMFHIPLPKGNERSETQLPEVKRWLNNVFYALTYEIDKLPVLIHCTSGKDRTGVVVGILLHILYIPIDIIAEEYLLSDGDVDQEELHSAIDGVGDPVKYFKGIDLNILRKKFLLNIREIP